MLTTTRNSTLKIQQGDDVVTLDADEALILALRIVLDYLPGEIHGPEMTRDLDAGTLTCPHCGHVHNSGDDAVIEVDASIRHNRGEYLADTDTVHVAAEDSNFQTVTYSATCCRKVVSVPPEVSVNFE